MYLCTQDKHKLIDSNLFIFIKDINIFFISIYMYVYRENEHLLSAIKRTIILIITKK